MSKRYAIWDKVSSVLTPAGELLTAEKWMERYPISKLSSIVVVCSAGEINGGFFGTLGHMKQICESQGASFDDGLDNQSLLDAIEAWEDEKASEISSQPTADERIAAAMEFQNMLML